MSQGQGSFQTNQRNIPQAAPGPPFVLTSANNGLSVDPISGKIVLGQDVGAGVAGPAVLISNREIPLGGFLLQAISSVGFQWFALDEPNSATQIGPDDGTNNSFTTNAISGGLSIAALHAQDPNTSANAALRINTGIQEDYQVQIQDATLQSSFALDNLNQVLEVAFQTFLYLQLDVANGIFQMGDFTPVSKASKLSIDDAGNTTILQSANSPSINKAEILLLSSPGSELISLFTTNALANQTFNSLDGANGVWRAFSDANGTFLRMSDFNQQVEAGNDNGGGTVIHYLKLDKVNELYQIGDVDDATTGTRIDIFATAQVINLRTLTEVMAEYDFSTGFAIVNLGDTNGVNNGAIVGIHDQAKEIVMQTTANDVKIRMNGVLGFTGTVTPVTTITVDGGIVTNVA